MTSISAAITRPVIADAARAFGKAPEDLLADIDKVTTALLATRADKAFGPATNDYGMEGVSLRKPATGEADGDPSSKATFFKLMAELMALLGEVSFSSLMSKLKAYSMRVDAQGQRLAKLGADLEAALVALGEAEQAAAEASGQAEAAEVEARLAREEAQRLRQELDAATPGSPEHDELAARLATAEDRAASLQAKAMDALANAANAVDDWDGVLEHVQQLQSQARPGLAGSEDHIDRVRSTIARKSEALAKLNDLLAQLSQEDLTRQSETIQMQLKAAEEANQKRAREFEAEQQKARDLQEKMGCWGKIIGWAVTVVSLVAAPFTGGASLALAAVGLALAIAEEVTGFSVLGAVLSPVIENVLMPMMKFLTTVFVDVVKGVADLIGAEINEDALNLAATILGAIAAVAIIVAVAVVAKSGASKFMEKFGTEIMKNVAKQIGAMLNAAINVAAKSASKVGTALPEALRTVMKTASARVGHAASEAMKAASKAASKAVSEVGNVFAETPEEAAKRMTYVSDAAAVGMSANQVAQGAGGVAVADMQRKAAVIEGQIMMSFANSKILRDLLQQAVDTFVASNATVENLRQTLSRIIAQDHNTGAFIARQIRA